MVLSMSISLLAQNQISFSEMKTIKKGVFEDPQFNSYLAQDNHLYKVGDTIKIGVPSSNKTFAFVEQGNALSGLNPANVRIASTSTIIKRIYIVGTKKSGYKVYFVGKGQFALDLQYYISVEDAINTQELKSLGHTSDEALSQLKKSKDKLDLGIITQDEYNKIKTELAVYIK
jgi:hypothetical protein